MTSKDEPSKEEFEQMHHAAQGAYHHICFLCQLRLELLEIPWRVLLSELKLPTCI
jgi:hypothetical protein